VKYYLLFLALMSLLALCLYGVDKRKARKNRWRIRESTLLLTGLFGGAVGALLGMELFRHKTKHWYFWAVNLLGLLAQAAAALFILRARH
jgi:uncharacterized membrane protein YsdA (DUF1294 family)